MQETGGGDRAALPEAHKRRMPPAGGTGSGAADSLPAAVVQPVGSRVGGSAVRLAGDALIRGHRPGAWAGTRRGDGDAVSLPAEEAEAGRADLRAGGSTACSARAAAVQKHDRRRDNHRGDQSTKSADGRRDPEMHQIKKRNQLALGRKLRRSNTSRTGSASGRRGGFVEMARLSYPIPYCGRTAPKIVYRTRKMWASAAVTNSRLPFLARPRKRTFWSPNTRLITPIEGSTRERNAGLRPVLRLDRLVDMVNANRIAMNRHSLLPLSRKVLGCPDLT